RGAEAERRLVAAVERPGIDEHVAGDPALLAEVEPGPPARVVVSSHGNPHAWTDGERPSGRVVIAAVPREQLIAVLELNREFAVDVARFLLTGAVLDIRTLSGPRQLADDLAFLRTRTEPQECGRLEHIRTPDEADVRIELTPDHETLRLNAV